MEHIFDKVTARLGLNGVMRILSNFLSYHLGVTRLEEENKRLKERISTLEYFLNVLSRPADLPPTQDADLRILQLCDAELLHILDKLFSKHGITYWMDYGTLLGAVRHHGFIPWDDDMDISLPRKDYIEVTTNLRSELGELGLSLYDNATVHNFGIGYKHTETGIWCDLFAMDIYETNDPIDKAYDDVKKGLDDILSKDLAHSQEPLAIIQRQIKEIMPVSVPNGKTKVYYEMPEFPSLYKNASHDFRTVYPLKKLVYESYSFNAPSQPGKYIERYIGKNYMKFPTGGVLHHGESTGRLPLSQWAKHNGVDMNEVLRKLKEIYEKV